MKKRPPIALVVHGHFYQPPRENPWTDEVPREPTAAPFPNWNARIHAECYRANAYARIYGVKDHIASIVNNYAGMSFDLGPTLARWLDKHDAQVMRRMCEGDSSQQASLGAGGAMAQVWGHPIAPLLSAHDLRTQILWGQLDFRRRFGRDPAGLWLPETAVNDATLAALIDAGVAYTILAPEQFEAVREPDGEWQPVTADTLDTGRAYRFLHPDGSGRHLALAIFDGPLSRDLAFGTATRDAASFLEAMRRSAERSKIEGKRLVLAASDGELYGHHKKFADLTLAYAVTVSAPADNIDITNLGAFLAESPPTWEARLRPGPNGEGTAWSCSHGLGRWLRDCGCRMHEVKGSSQAWRGPLRRALDHLRDRAAVFFEDAAADLFEDPWQARDAYGEVADDDPETRKKLLRTLGRPSLRQGRGDAPERALLHMEMQRSLLLMYASCAWFFDDIAGPEAALALRRAAHAMDTWAALGGKPPEKSFTGILARARSNRPRLGTGADAFARACRDRITPAKAITRAAFSCMASSSASHDDVPGFTVKTDCACTQHGPRSLAGQAEVTSLRTGERTTLTFAASHDGEAEFACQVTEMGTLGGLALHSAPTSHPATPSLRSASPCPPAVVRVRRSRTASHATRQDLGLDDLDEEAARALRLGALVRMAAGAREATVCRSLLEVADKLGACTTGEIGALTGLFARALADYLEQTLPAGTRPQHRPSGKASRPADWRLVLALADRAGPMQPTDNWRRVQEVVWEHMEALRRLRAPQPKPLRTLAMRLQLAKTAATE